MSRALLFIVQRSAFIILLLALPGCALLGVAAYKVAGPPAVPAKHVPAQTPMLVMVENYRHQSSANPSADQLARFLMTDLEANRVAPLVPLEKLQALRDGRPTEFAKMPIAAIGRHVGARQILYVELLRSDVSPVVGADSLSGESRAAVKLVDVATGDTIWPAEIAGGYPVTTAATPGGDHGQSPQDIRQRMHRQLSDQIAKLFYKWKPADMAPEDYAE